MGSNNQKTDGLPSAAELLENVPRAYMRGADDLFSAAEADPALPKALAKEREARLRTSLIQAQYDRLQENQRSLLIVVTGLDGVGKGAAINQLNEWMDPRHINTIAFGEPTQEQAMRPPLWRYWNALPARGRTGIVFGSWYEAHLRQYAHSDMTSTDLLRGIREIRAFEALLAAEGVQIIKLWFHMSREAQSARTQELLSNKMTAWQVTDTDKQVAENFKAIRDIGAAAIEATQTPYAPWHVIPSADERVRAIETASIVLKALQAPPRKRITPPADSSVPCKRPVTLDLPADTPRLSRKQYKKTLLKWQARLGRLVREAAFGKRSLVLALEGMDASGKGGSIRRITRALDARSYEVVPISAPTDEELAHPYLWRFWRHVPGNGRTTVFDRTWYGRVLVERVEGLINESARRRAYAEINDFERQLHEHGTIVIKVWLSINRDEQLRRFHEREHNPAKRYKITPDDWRNRKRWSQYEKAARDMLQLTHTEHAPWCVLPANDKRQARVALLQHIVTVLEKALKS